ncbi:LysR family transcriptional regulator [Variovorax sp. WS11]|uniref:LysR family transcriptional regulator n=1 Tax=Variovorax sp. WS11 TaxID=1105204 RepID=UPI000D0E24A3|nr:LysR family transcriptional regulator [Variovorax sp. WS11]NDZ18793.1 LysR family transcriptional regulator [Variovorax sp. WS11]PSL82569.1 LysR family transcriptional regulator [Variovorax sp. WS11]
MDEFTCIRTFIKVVEAGSFSSAAGETSVSAVARQVKSLEEELGVRLLNRNTRGLSPTDAGRRFYERVTGISNDLENAVSEARSLQEEVKGLLRVSLRVAMGTTVVVPELPKLLAQYPELCLEIQLTDERQDLIANNIDVAVWLGHLPDSHIVARRLSRSQRIVCGTQAYFERHGVPHIPQDLPQHNCLLYTAATFGTRWSFTKEGEYVEVEARGSIRTDNGLILLSSALADIGIIVVHEWMVRQHLAERRLVKVLTDYKVNPRPGDADLYAVWPSSRGMSRKVRAFVDFLLEAFARL